MKFMNFVTGASPSARLGVESTNGVVDLTLAGRMGLVQLANGATLPEVIAAEGALDALEDAVRSLPAEALAPCLVPPGDIRCLAPVPNPEKIIGIGLNYHDHAEEVGMVKPTEPLLFAMWANTVIGPGDAILLPRVSGKIDYEAELAVVIGRRGRNIPVEKSTDFIAGYTIVNDVSARDLQMKDNQWVRGKSFDTALPMGPVLVTTRDLADAKALDIGLKLNGRTMQSSNTRKLIFNVPELVSYISEAMTLKPGDIIATGTPGGVGFKRKPPVFLKPDDVVEIELEGIGVLRNPVKIGE